jgi:hypothetical protein
MHNQKYTENTEVSLYLVKNKISADDVLKNNLSKVVLDESPVFTRKDIIEYSQSEHTIKLTKEAFEKFKAIRGDISWGKVFAICVDNKPVLLGTTWYLYASTSTCNGLSAMEAIMGCNEIELEYCISNPDASDVETIIDYTRKIKLIFDSFRRNNEQAKKRRTK